MRTIAVWNAKITRDGDEPQQRRGIRFLVWRVTTVSGIGFEEEHFTGSDGLDPFDPGRGMNWETEGLAPSFVFQVPEHQVS